MAQYRFSVQKAVSRGKGQSAIAKAAYNGREQLTDERTGQKTRDYGKPTNNSRGQDDILMSGLFMDTKRNSPEWAKDRNLMWNAAIAAEKRKDAREAQEIIVNLPWEITEKAREYMLTDFCRELTRGTGRIADVNMHKAPEQGDDRNIHAHILLTVREIRPDGFTGKRLEVTPEQIEKWKEKWAERGAKELQKAGFGIEAERWAVGHLKKEQQRDAALDRVDLEHAHAMSGPATKHLGPSAAAMERNGKGSDRSDILREEFTAGQEVMKLKRELAVIEKQIAAAEREAQRETREGGKTRMYRGVGNNVWPSEHGEALFFSTDPSRAAAFGKLYFVDVTPAEMAKFERPHSKRILEAEPVAKNDWRTADPAIIARLKPLEIAREQQTPTPPSIGRRQEPSGEIPERPPAPRFEPVARAATKPEKDVKPTAQPAKIIANDNKPNIGVKAPSRAIDLFGKAAAKLAEGVFSMFVADPPKTPAQIAKAADEAQREAVKQEIDWSKYLYNTEHERIAANQQEQKRQRDQDRDDYRKREPDRER